MNFKDYTIVIKFNPNNKKYKWIGFLLEIPPNQFFCSSTKKKKLLKLMKKMFKLYKNNNLHINSSFQTVDLYNSFKKE